jgi:UDP-glucose 4-epimerase
MKIFVTGGTGFVGSHLIKSFLAQGHDVTIFDNLSNSKKNQVTSLKENGAVFILGDITNYNLLAKKIVGFDFVIHLAARINVAESILFPEFTHTVNVTGTLNLLRACVKNKVKNIIAASSAAVYGNQKVLPLSEDSTTMPISPYGATKLAIEHYLQAFSNCYSINAISLRFFNIYGQGQSLEYAGVIEKFMNRIKSNKHLIIYGDGKNTRDFVSIDDVVRSIILAMKKIGGKKGDVYNIASGNSTSINDLAKTMISLSGKKLEIMHKRPKKGDIRHSRASINLAKRDLDYAPQVSLRNGLEKLIHV